MNVVDSSGWLEYFANGRNAQFFSAPIEDVAQLLVPTITLSEVFNRVLAQRGERDALEAAAVMQQGQLHQPGCSDCTKSGADRLRAQAAISRQHNPRVRSHLRRHRLDTRRRFRTSRGSEICYEEVGSRPLAGRNAFTSSRAIARKW